MKTRGVKRDREQDAPPEGGLPLNLLFLLKEIWIKLIVPLLDHTMTFFLCITRANHFTPCFIKN